MGQPKKKHRELLFSITKKDFDLQFFCSGGPGGQNVNKVASGCRIIHRASGAVGEGREHRDQPKNREAAFKRLVKTPEFLSWHRIKCAEMMGLMDNIEKEVDAMMQPQFLKVEVQRNGKWVKVDPDPTSLEWNDLIDGVDV
jgi:protein subunit release factor B